MGTRWVTLVNLASAVEAETFVQRLRAAGLHATTKGNDIVGIFGPGFSGATARGVDVLVTSDGLAAATHILADYRRAV